MCCCVKVNWRIVWAIRILCPLFFGLGWLGFGLKWKAGSDFGKEFQSKCRESTEGSSASRILTEEETTATATTETANVDKTGNEKESAEEREERIDNFKEGLKAKLKAVSDAKKVFVVQLNKHNCVQDLLDFVIECASDRESEPEYSYGMQCSDIFNPYTDALHDMQIAGWILGVAFAIACCAVGSKEEEVKQTQVVTLVRMQNNAQMPNAQMQNSQMPNSQMQNSHMSNYQVQMHNQEVRNNQQMLNQQMYPQIVGISQQHTVVGGPQLAQDPAQMGALDPVQTGIPVKADY